MRYAEENQRSTKMGDGGNGLNGWEEGTGTKNKKRGEGGVTEGGKMEEKTEGNTRKKNGTTNEVEKTTNTVKNIRKESRQT